MLYRWSFDQISQALIYSLSAQHLFFCGASWIEFNLFEFLRKIGFGKRIILVGPSEKPFRRALNVKIIP